MQGFINERAFGETLIYHFAQFPRHFEYLEERHPAGRPLTLAGLAIRIVSRPPSGERYFSFYGGAENFRQFFRFFLDYFLEFGGRNGFFLHSGQSRETRRWASIKFKADERRKFGTPKSTSLGITPMALFVWSVESIK